MIVVVKAKQDEKLLKAALKHGKEWESVLSDKKYEQIAKSQSWKKEPEASFADDGSIFFTSGTYVFLIKCIVEVTNISCLWTCAIPQ